MPNTGVIRVLGSAMAIGSGCYVALVSQQFKPRDDSPLLSNIAPESTPNTNLRLQGVDACASQPLSNSPGAVLSWAEFNRQGETSENAVRPNDQGRQSQMAEKLKVAVNKAKEVCWSKMYESGVPGLVVGVAVDGKVVWKHGFGYADIENKVLANSNTVMRIASISKSITAAVVAKLWEEGAIDLDKPVSEYVEAWPNEHPNITMRQLLSHTSGIRHYARKEDKVEKEENNVKLQGEAVPKEFCIMENYKDVQKALELFKNDQLLSEPGERYSYTTHGYTLVSAVVEAVTKEKFTKYMKRIFGDLGLWNTVLDEHETIVYNRSRYYVRNEKCHLKNAPYVDNSYKWAGGGFLSNVCDLVKFGNIMLYSYQSSKEKEGLKLLPNDVKRSSKDVNNNFNADSEPPSDFNEIEAADVAYHPSPYSAVNSGKKEKDRLPGFLKSETVKALWYPVVHCDRKTSDIHYGLGWSVRPASAHYAFCKDQRYVVSHTGGAMGASSVLLILPRREYVDGYPQDEKVMAVTPLSAKIPSESMRKCDDCGGMASFAASPERGCIPSPPQGVVVAIICNMSSVSLSKLALEIATTFETLRNTEEGYRVRKVYQC